MIFKVIRYLWRLTNRDYVPPLPRGMLAAPYEVLNRSERRVIARYGARCPAGVNAAMRRRRAADVDSLVSQLEHFRPRRKIMRRLNQMIDRATMATQRNPHARALLEYDRESRRRDDATARRLYGVLDSMRRDAR